MPREAKSFDCPVFGFQPRAKLGLRGGAKAFLRVALVPHVVAQGGGLVAISLDESRQELPGLTQHIVIVQTKRRATSRATAANGREAPGSVAVDLARVRVFIPHPLRRAGDHFRDDRSDMVLAF
jgi:hypothetical protein